MLYTFFAVTLPIGKKLREELGDPYQVQDLSLLLSRLVGLLIMAAAIAAFFYLILGGLQWITSGGDKAGTEAAREKITAAFIGLAIVATSWATFLLIQWFLGLNILAPSGPPGNGAFARCPDGDEGQPGQACDNPNRCDIAGGCNPACCAVDSECVGPLRDGACNQDNDYCRSGKSCGPP